jgi:hypothetical protein
MMRHRARSTTRPLLAAALALAAVAGTARASELPVAADRADRLQPPAHVVPVAADAGDRHLAGTADSAVPLAADRADRATPSVATSAAEDRRTIVLAVLVGALLTGAALLAATRAVLTRRARRPVGSARVGPADASR